MAPELFHRIEEEKGGDESENDEEEVEQSGDEEEDVEPGHIAGEGMKCMVVIVPAMDPFGEILGELESSQEMADNLEPFKGMCRT